MKNQNIFMLIYWDLKIIRENYRKERDDYKIDLACGAAGDRAIYHKKCSGPCKLSRSTWD